MLQRASKDFFPESEDRYASSEDPAYASSERLAIGITDILRTLRREWWFPVFGCLIGLTLAVSYIVFVPTFSLYKSSARILLDTSMNRYLQTNKIVDKPIFDETEMGSQVHILSSESIVVPVIRSMNLTRDSEFVGPPNARGAQISWINELKKIVKQFIGLDDDATIDTDTVLECTAVETFLQRLSVNREDVPNVINVNLAALMVASTGARTLIIDGDLHLRRLTTKLAPDARRGLIEALLDPSRLSEFICKRPRSGLDVLPCVLSNRVPNAAELLGSPRMEQLLDVAREAYDYIIIEVAPIMSVVDFKVIKRFIDRFVFVVEWGHTKRSLVLEALSEAQIIREHLIGIVLNKADPHALRSIEAYKDDRFRDYYEG